MNVDGVECRVSPNAVPVIGDELIVPVWKYLLTTTRARNWMTPSAAGKREGAKAEVRLGLCPLCGEVSQLSVSDSEAPHSEKLFLERVAECQRCKLFFEVKPELIAWLRRAIHFHLLSANVNVQEAVSLSSEEKERIHGA